MNDEKKPIELGFVEGLSNEEYHRGPGVSKSQLDTIANESPGHLNFYRQHPKPSTPAMMLGTALHHLVLEEGTFFDAYYLEPENAPKRPTASQLNSKNPTEKAQASINFWTRFDANNKDKICLPNTPGKSDIYNPGLYDQVQRMRDSVMNHPIASILLDPDDGVAELSCYWIDKTVNRLCRCRPDFLNDSNNVAVDLKTTRDASFTGFGKSCGEFRYNVQDAFYTDGLKAAGRKISDFVFVAVESKPPYATGVYTLRPEERRIGRVKYQSNLATYDRCKKEDRWPFYPEEVRDLVIPPWGLKGKIL